MQFKKSIAFAAFLALTACTTNRSASVPAEKPSGKTATASFYDFKLKTLAGDETIDFNRFRGKKVVILNTASECGYTPQYADWQAFYEKNLEKVIVIGIPSNQFGGQEPGSNAEIKTFCQKNYGVTFPMFEKTEVKGEGKSPLYRWLTDKSLNGWNEQEPTWNFCKYVVGEDGELLRFFNSKVKPTDEAFLAAVRG